MGFLESIRRKRTYAIFSFWIDDAFAFDSLAALSAYQFLILEPDKNHWSVSLLAFTNPEQILNPEQAAATASKKMVFEKRGKNKTPQLIQTYMTGLITEYLQRGPHRKHFLRANSLSLRFSDEVPNQVLPASKKRSEIL